MSAISRRGFLQAAAAASAVGATIPRWMMTAGATPLAADQGMVLVVNLGGGLDPLSVLIPASGQRRIDYEAARPDVALPADTLLPATADHGFNPLLPGISSRFARGDVAIIDGIGLPKSLRSHSVSTVAMQSASMTPITTGWLGRHLDGYADRGDELMSVAVSATVPLSVRGHVNSAAALPPGVGMWGASPAWNFDKTTADAVRQFASAPIGRGPWADQAAQVGAYALDKAAVSTGLSTSSKAKPGLRQDMEIAAHVFNADIGTRVITVNTSGFDTHGDQNRLIRPHLIALDQAIDGFFATLAPERHNRVTILVVSEFGRKAGATSSLGTDHGYAGLSMLIGPNVAGGLHTESPSISALDAQGCLVPTADFRSVYSAVIDTWLAGDSSDVLGGTYQPLGLFAAAPGTTA